MFVRSMSNYPPYKAGQCLEIHDHIGGPLVGSILEIVPADVVREYERTLETIDRIIDKRIGADLRTKAAESADKSRTMSAARAARRVTEDQWRHEIGQDQPGYWQAAMAHRQVRS